MKKIVNTLVMAALGITTAEAAVDLANAPLFLTPRVDPNILFVLDDSGSMQLEVLTGDDIPDRARFVYPWESAVYNDTNSSHDNYVPSFYDDDGLAGLGLSADLLDIIGGLIGGLLGLNSWSDVSLDDLDEDRDGLLDDIDNTALSQELARLFVHSAYYRSPQTNKLYYNPSITYRPWINADGTSMDMAKSNDAFHNPIKEDKGKRDLTKLNEEQAHWTNCQVVGPANIQNCSIHNETREFWPAVYYWHEGGGSVSLPQDYTRVAVLEKDENDDEIIYSGHGRENRTDCVENDDGSCTYDEEIQNFANWYTYYRSRVLAARAGIGSAFAEQAENLRVGFGAINSSPVVVQGVLPFQGDDREAFFNNLYGHNIPYASTPLRNGLKAAGEYYETDPPWRDDPTDSESDMLSCRGSYTILMTDGYWSGGSPGVNNVDNTAGVEISAPDGTTYQYTLPSPYSDGYSDTLADVAMHYWNRDLRSDLINNVPTSAANEAFWQHMVTFGVGLGVTGSLDPEATWSAVKSTNSDDWPNWPSPSTDTDDIDTGKIDDLLHAAVNGHGGFFSAADPEGFAEGLGEVLDTIVARVESSATAAAVSAAVLQGDTLLYSAGFRSSDWSGSFKAYRLDAEGELDGAAWDAEAKLAARDLGTRNVFTLRREDGEDDEDEEDEEDEDEDGGTYPGPGIPFEYLELSEDQQDALDQDADGEDGEGAARVAWLKGDDSAGSDFRRRNPAGALRLLGDVVNADPVFMGHTNYHYTTLPGTEGTAYADFLESKASRPEVMFVAANDGMLHAFDASSDTADGGKELFAYLPSELLLPEPGRDHAPLTQLMDADYQHRYFHDGTPAGGDAYIDTGSGKAWHSVLVGTMGAGGRTVYALDVTDPKNFTADDVLWEFTDPDLGYGVSQPIITRVRPDKNNPDSERWAAIFGNGYNSDNHEAMLFIVDLATGDLLGKSQTKTGDTDTPNGLGMVTVTDAPEYGLTAQHVYAGDLLGNLWRFPLDDDQEHWSHDHADVVFEAEDPDETPQPITVAPRLASAENGDLMVLFGTGSYFRDQDASSTQVQSLYGIRDEPGKGGKNERKDLKEQTISWQQTHTVAGVDYRLRGVEAGDQTGNKGWYLDLMPPDKSATGERVIAEATFPQGVGPQRVRFTTLVPDSDPCGYGRSGYVMDLMIDDGGRSEGSVFDLNRDDQVNADDKVMVSDNAEVASGVGFGAGERITTLSQTDSSLELIYSGDPENEELTPDGGPIQGKGGETPPGRQSWLQIR